MAIVVAPINWFHLEREREMIMQEEFFYFSFISTALTFIRFIYHIYISHRLTSFAINIICPSAHTSYPEGEIHASFTCTICSIL